MANSRGEGHHAERACMTEIDDRTKRKAEWYKLNWDNRTGCRPGNIIPGGGSFPSAAVKGERKREIYIPQFIPYFFSNNSSSQVHWLIKLANNQIQFLCFPPESIIIVITADAVLIQAIPRTETKQNHN